MFELWASVGAWGGRGQCEAITGHPFHSPGGSKASEQSRAGWKDKDDDDDDTMAINRHKDGKSK